jgi:predicted nuclease of predicted toxin-antitoxin system
MAERPILRFFIDHCVPDSVGHALRAAGHDVVFLREQLAPDSPDPLVAAVAEANGAILVSLDTDFKTLAPRAHAGKARFRTLSRIGVRCSEPQAAARISEALSLIEHEWSVAQAKPDKRMIVEIMTTAIRTIR